MLQRVLATLAALALPACATPVTAQGDPGPIAAYGNVQTFEIAPVLLAAEDFYPGETTVHGVPSDLWPIPQSELDINPSLTQNPGWE